MKRLLGMLPKAGEQALNFDFETGTLQDWKATGEAFSKPLISEDPSPMHEKDMNINHTGQYFVSSGGTKNHATIGTLTSVPFK